MQFITILSLLILAPGIFAADDDTSPPPPTNNQAACFLEKIRNVQGPAKNTTTSTFSGSDLFNRCQKMIIGNWQELSMTSNKSADSLMTKFKNQSGYIAFINAQSEFARLYNKEIASVNTIATAQPQDATQTCKARRNNVTELVKIAASQLVDLRNDLLNCMALATMTTEVDFTDRDHTNKGETSSADGKLKCSTMGAETQDFPACKKFAYLYTSFLVGQKGLEVVQNVNYTTSNMDRQEQLAKSTDGKAKKSLEAQRDAVEEQKKMADTNVAFHGAKGASLFAAYKMIPTQNDLIDRCKKIVDSRLIDDVSKNAVDSLKGLYSNQLIQNNSNNIINFETIIDDEVPKYDKNPCDEVVNRANVFMNEKVRQAMLEMMMQAGVDTLANAGKSMILDKQVGMMDKAIGDLNDFTASVTIPTFATASVTADYCTMYPTDTACADLVNSRRYDLGVGGITIGGGGTLTTGEQAAATVDTATSSLSGTSDRSNTIGPTGAVVSGIPKNGGFETTVGAASMKDVPGAGNSGGGGGGGPSSVSAPSGGGGGGGDSSGGSSGGTAGAKGVAYIGGANHNTYAGGLGNAKKKPETNPLDGLFNKNQTAKTGGDVLDFRGVASINDKEKDLFKLISNRYDTISKSRRLIEYDSIPKKE